MRSPLQRLPAHRLVVHRVVATLFSALLVIGLPSTDAARVRAEDPEPIDAADSGPPESTGSEPSAPTTPADEPREDASPPRLSTVHVIGDAEGDVLGVPGSGAVVTGETLRANSYDSTEQALRAVPGVYVRPEGDGYGLFPNISLRGVDTTRSAKVSLMEDGVLTAPAPYSSPSAYYSPTAGRMSAVEVLKGSSQVLYGPHTTGGVVNYVSTPIPEDRRVYLRALLGSFDEIRTHVFYGETFDARDHDPESRLGRFGWLLESYFRSNEGFKEIDETGDFLDGDDTGFRKSEPMLKLFWEPDLNVYSRIEAKVGYTDLLAREGYLGLSEADFGEDPFRRYSASRFDSIQSKQTRSYLRYTIEPTDTTEVETTLYYNVFRRDWFKLNDVRDAGGNRASLSRALAADGTHLATLRGEAAGEFRVRHNNREYHAWGAQTTVRQEFETFEMPHVITAGARYHEDEERRFQTDENFTQNAAGVVTARAIEAPGGAGDREESSKALAFFLQDRIELTERLSVSPGVRYEHVDQRYRDFDSGDRGSGNLDVFAGGVGANFRVCEELELFAGLFQGFSVPGPRAASRSALDEETSLSFELGPRYRHESGFFSVDGALFLTRFDDLIVIDNVGGTGTGDTENIGRVDTIGVELGIEADPASLLELPFANPWRFGFTWTHAEIRDNARSTDPESIFAGAERGNKLPYIPEFALTLGTGIEWTRFGVRATASWVDETFTSASNTSSQLDAQGQPDARFGKTDGYLLVDLSASYDVTDTIRLFGGIQNALDEEYVASRHPHGPRSGAPLFLYVGLEIDLDGVEIPGL